MIITACQAWLYKVPLTATLFMGGQSLDARSGLIIRISDDSNHDGYGEVAPLPGLHRESIETALRQFRALQSVLLGQALPEGLQALQGGFECWLGGYFLCPSLRYGLEVAVLNLLACAQNSTLARLLNPSYRKTLLINGLLLDGLHMENQAKLLSEAGYTAIKVKVGRQALPADIATVRAARKVLGDHVALRLDANRLWDYATAVDFGEAITDCGVEYIEEPVANPKFIQAFHQTTAIPVALDESLTETDPASLIVPEGVKLFVLKPAVIGGLEKTMGFIRLARQYQIKTVISSVFESGVGLAALANSAAALADDVPAGLDTYRWLGEDLLKKRFATCGAKIDVDQIYHQGRQLRTKLLRKVV